MTVLSLVIFLTDVLKQLYYSEISFPFTLPFSVDHRLLQQERFLFFMEKCAKVSYTVLSTRRDRKLQQKVQSLDVHVSSVYA